MALTLADRSAEAEFQAVETLYHGFLTGCLLSVVVGKGGAAAAEMTFRLFRTQHEEKFLPGLKKLGLTGLPDPVACALYHYHSNSLGGVRVQYMRESDKKAWVRYLPPRWIFSGTAICGIPGEVSRAMVRAWHAYNGITLENPKLGYVCTKQTPEGQPGLEGYFLEYDHDLKDTERLRYAPGEDGPDFDPAKAPALAMDDWPEERLRKAMRNYSVDYIRTLLPVAVVLFGPAEATHLLGHAGRMIGMASYQETSRLLGIEDGAHGNGSPESFAQYLGAMCRGAGEAVELGTENGKPAVKLNGWRLMRERKHLSPAVFQIWNTLMEGALAVHNRHLRLDVLESPANGTDPTTWSISG